VPIGALTSIAANELKLRGVVLPPDGSQRIEAEIAGRMEHAEALGQALAENLRGRGAEALLARV
jgi:hydroxymethylbilane synthase